MNEKDAYIEHLENTISEIDAENIGAVARMPLRSTGRSGAARKIRETATGKAKSTIATMMPQMRP